MAARLTALALLLCLGGCAVLQPAYDVAADRRTFAACKLGDALTTVGILKAGGAEVNPVMKALLGSAPYNFLPFVAVSAALVGLVWWIDQPEVTAGASIVTCPVVGHNVIQLVK